jgi:hypothetical protein
LPLGLTATDSTLTVVGQRETDTTPYTTYVAAGAPSALTIQSTPNIAHEENDLFGAVTAAEGTTWAVGWALDIKPSVHAPLILKGVHGSGPRLPTRNSRTSTAALKPSPPCPAAACGPSA